MASTAFTTVRLPLPSFVVNRNPSVSRARLTLLGSISKLLPFHLIIYLSKLFPYRVCFLTNSSSSLSLSGSRRNSLRIHAVSKQWEPTKVSCALLFSSFYLCFLDNSYHFHPSADFQVVPQADRVLIRLEELAEKSAGGILLPKSAVKFERYLVGEVLSVGAEAEEVEAGQKVLLSDVNAYEVDLGTDGRHCFCRASDLLAVVE
ncbi:10 kDa chaperonin 2, chloroplastic [Linum perenne]